MLDRTSIPKVRGVRSALSNGVLNKALRLSEKVASPEIKQRLMYRITVKASGICSKNLQSFARDYQSVKVCPLDLVG